MAFSASSSSSGGGAVAASSGSDAVADDDDNDVGDQPAAPQGAGGAYGDSMARRSAPARSRTPSVSPPSPAARRLGPASTRSESPQPTASSKLPTMVSVAALTSTQPPTRTAALVPTPPRPPQPATASFTPTPRTPAPSMASLAPTTRTASTVPSSATSVPSAASRMVTIRAASAAPTTPPSTSSWLDDSSYTDASSTSSRLAELRTATQQREESKGFFEAVYDWVSPPAAPAPVYTTKLENKDETPRAVVVKPEPMDPQEPVADIQRRFSALAGRAEPGNDREELARQLELKTRTLQKALEIANERGVKINQLQAANNAYAAQLAKADPRRLQTAEDQNTKLLQEQRLAQYNLGQLQQRLQAAETAKNRAEEAAQSYQKECAALQERLKKGGAVASDADEKRLRARIADLETRLAAASAAHLDKEKAWEAAMKVRMDELQEARRANTSGAEALAEKAELVNRLQGQLEEMRDKYERSQERVGELEYHLKDASQAATQADAALAKMTSQLDSVRQAANEVLAKRDSELEKAREDLSDAEKQRATWKARAYAIEQEKRAQENAKAELQMDLDKAAAALMDEKEFAEEKRQIESAIAEAVARRDSAEKQMRSLVQTVRDRDNTIQQLRSTAGPVPASGSASASLEEKIVDLERKLTDTRTDYESRLEGIDSELRAHQEKVRMLTHRLTRKSQAIEKLQGEVRAQKDAREALDTADVVHREELDLAKDELETLRSQLAQKQIQYESTLSEVRATAVAEFRRLVTESKASTDRMEAELRRLREEKDIAALDGLQQQITDLKTDGTADHLDTKVQQRLIQLLREGTALAHPDDETRFDDSMPPLIALSAIDELVKAQVARSSSMVEYGRRVFQRTRELEQERDRVREELARENERHLRGGSVASTASECPMPAILTGMRHTHEGARPWLDENGEKRTAAFIAYPVNHPFTHPNEGMSSRLFLWPYLNKYGLPGSDQVQGLVHFQRFIHGLARVDTGRVFYDMFLNCLDPEDVARFRRQEFLNDTTPFIMAHTIYRLNVLNDGRYDDDTLRALAAFPHAVAEVTSFLVAGDQNAWLAEAPAHFRQYGDEERYVADWVYVMTHKLCDHLGHANTMDRYAILRGALVRTSAGAPQAMSGWYLDRYVQHAAVIPATLGLLRDHSMPLVENLSKLVPEPKGAEKALAVFMCCYDLGISEAVAQDIIRKTATANPFPKGSAIGMKSSAKPVYDVIGVDEYSRQFPDRLV